MASGPFSYRERARPEPLIKAFKEVLRLRKVTELSKHRAVKWIGLEEDYLLSSKFPSWYILQDMTRATLCFSKIWLTVIHGQHVFTSEIMPMVSIFI